MIYLLGPAVAAFLITTWSRTRLVRRRERQPQKSCTDLPAAGADTIHLG